MQTDLQVPGHPDVFAAGDAAAVPDVTQPGKITPPTAQHATRQGKVLARNVAASLGWTARTPTNYKHRNMGLVVDLGPRYAVANPLNIQLSGFPAKAVTRAYHLYAIPRFVNRWAVSLAYLTDVFFDRSVVSMGLSSRRMRSSPPARASRCRRRTNPLVGGGVPGQLEMTAGAQVPASRCPACRAPGCTRPQRVPASSFVPRPGRWSTC